MFFCKPADFLPAGTSYIRYQLAANLPSNFIAIGDSVMTVNPLYAYGYSLRAAISANTLVAKVVPKHSWESSH